MQRESCLLFDHLTGRAEPALPHPTSKSFDSRAYSQALSGKPSNHADAQLLVTAALIGSELEELRTRFPAVLGELSRTDVIRLAVASSNRASMITLGHVRKHHKESLSENTPQHLSAIGEFDIPAPQSGMSPDSISMAVIDALPHWFAQAMELPEEVPHDTHKPSAHYRKLHAAAEHLTSLERALRDLWQQFLWEPWMFHPKKLEIFPANWDDAALWHAWQYRQNSIHMQRVYLDEFLPLPDDEEEVVNHLSVTAAKWQGGRYKIRVGKPNKADRRRQSIYMTILKSSYLAPFLNLQIPKTGVVVFDVVRALLCLKSLASALQNEVKGIEFNNRFDFKRLAFEFSTSQLAKILANCLSTDQQKAESILDLLVCDPTNLNDAFSHGLWHRPLIAHPHHQRLLFSTAIAMDSDPIYALERLFRATDLQNSIEKRQSLGLAFEEKVRESLSEAVQSNEILNDVSIAQTALTKTSETGEEIDILMRIDRLVLVGDVKCFVRPADSIDRYSYLEKLNKAAAQVERKRNWIAKNPATLKKALGNTNFKCTDLIYVPLVILNNGAGVGLKIGETLFTDAHWLRLLLSDGSYESGGMRNLETRTYTRFVTHLYSSTQDLISSFPELITNCPGLQSFVAGTQWKDVSFPLSIGENITMHHPYLDNEAMINSIELMNSTTMKVYPLPVSDS